MDLQPARQFDYLQRTLSIFLTRSPNMSEQFESLIDELIKENKLSNQSPKVWSFLRRTSDFSIPFFRLEFSWILLLRFQVRCANGEQLASAITGEWPTLSIRPKLLLSHLSEETLCSRSGKFEAAATQASEIDDADQRRGRRDRPHQQQEKENNTGRETEPWWWRRGRDEWRRWWDQSETIGISWYGWVRHWIRTGLQQMHVSTSNLHISTNEAHRWVWCLFQGSHDRERQSSSWMSWMSHHVSSKMP